MKQTRIVTHPGKAHIDEAVGAALICIAHSIPKNGFKIIREVAKKSDLRSNSVWVLDQGGELSWHKKIVDHHQNGDLACTAELIALKFFPQIMLIRRNFYRLMERITLQDTRGPAALVDHIGANREKPLWSLLAVEQFAVRQFEKNPTHAVADIFVPMMERIIAEDGAEMGAIEHHRRTMQVLTTELHGIRVGVVDTKDVEFSPTMLGVNRVAKELGIDVTIRSDSRYKTGTVLYREPWVTDIDFRKLEESDRLSFFLRRGPHASGFLASLNLPFGNADYLPSILSMIDHCKVKEL